MCPPDPIENTCTHCNGIVLFKNLHNLLQERCLYKRNFELNANVRWYGYPLVPLHQILLLLLLLLLLLQ